MTAAAVAVLPRGWSVPNRTVRLHTVYAPILATAERTGWIRYDDNKQAPDVLVLVRGGRAVFVTVSGGVVAAVAATDRHGHVLELIVGDTAEHATHTLLAAAQ